MKCFVLSCLLGLLVCYFEVVTGLQCYTCSYIDGYSISNHYSHTSCKDGSKPDSKFLQTCGKKNDPHVKDWSCGKFVTEVKLNNRIVKVTARRCITRAMELDGICNGKKAVQDIEKFSVNQDNMDVTFAFLCSCNEDSCNSSTILKTSLGVIVPLFAFIVFQFIENF